jgi:hypothetical protein
MNRSPDRFDRDLAAERTLREGDPRSAELAADRALLDELRGLGAEPLPEGVRQRVMKAARRRRYAPLHVAAPWWVAAAASIALIAVAAVLRLAPAPPGPGQDEFAELGLALNTINRTGRRAVAIAGREVSRSLALPDLALDELPYAGVVRRTLAPGRRDASPSAGPISNPNPTEENTQ